MILDMDLRRKNEESFEENTFFIYIFPFVL